MPIDTIKFEDEEYPAFQANGNAARFALPFAREVCHGMGMDVGCGKREWAFPGATYLVDPSLSGGDDALNITHIQRYSLDYVFSSHCLEHLQDWVAALDHWQQFLKIGGILFLYLPDYSQRYWRPWNNRKHNHVLTPTILRDYMLARGYKNVFTSGVDFYNSFMAMGVNQSLKL